MNTAIKIKVDDAALRKMLATLAPEVNEQVRKKGARKALNPFLATLRGLWRNTAFRRGKGLHRKAIASATRVDIRRGGSGVGSPLQIRMGVQYGHKGGARAKRRQRVWHLLENGFRHHGGTMVPGRRISTRFATSNIGKIGDAITKETFAAAKSVLRMK